MAAMAERYGCARRAGSVAAAGLALVGVSGCLDRPLSTTEPQTSNVVVRQLAQQPPSTIDGRFMTATSRPMAANPWRRAAWMKRAIRSAAATHAQRVSPSSGRSTTFTWEC